MKKLLVLIGIILLLPIAKAATIAPASKSIDLLIGTGSTVSFNLTLNNETCSPTISSQLQIFGLPSFTNASGKFSVNFYVYAAPDLTSGTYQSNITYCNANFALTTSLSSTQNQTPSNCASYLKIYGEKTPGKTIKFDLRNTNYKRVRNPDTSISIESSDTGNTYSIDCAEGSCSWKIPETEKGTLIIEAIIPDCEPITQEIEIEPAGSISVSVPSEVKMGEDFYIYFFDPMKGALKYVTAQVIAPNGNTFNGKTNENGILYDESLSKVYGKDVKPEQTGTYRIFANLLGYTSVNKTFDVIKVECPFECCINEPQYLEKTCQEGFLCKNNVCKEIVKPKLEFNCTPEPTLTQTSHCVLQFANGTKISKNVDVNFTLNGKTKTITFASGEADITFEDKGNYMLQASIAGFETATLRGEVQLPEIGIPIWVVLIIFIALIALIIAAIWIFKKRRKLRPQWRKETEETYPIEEGE